ncbi:MAG: alpha/beta fold hydrolase, partial [Dehalococcoidia bacterium]
MAELRQVRATDGTVLPYETLGGGEPVVFLHGSLNGRDSFDRQREALSAGYRLILRDLRGHN